jgi:hypothetical protein
MQESVTFQQDSYQDKNRPPSPKASPKVQKSPKTASAASRSRFFGKRGSMSHIETREDSGQSSLSGQERFERYLSPYPGRRIRTTSTGSDKSNLNVNASGKAPRVTSFDDDEADGFDDNDSDKEEEDEGADHGLIELVPILVVLFGCAWHSPPFFLFPVKCRDMHTYIHTHTHVRARARTDTHTHTSFTRRSHCFWIRADVRYLGYLFSETVRFTGIITIMVYVVHSLVLFCSLCSLVDGVHSCLAHHHLSCVAPPLAVNEWRCGCKTPHAVLHAHGYAIRACCWHRPLKPACKPTIVPRCCCGFFVTQR